MKALRYWSKKQKKMIAILLSMAVIVIIIIIGYQRNQKYLFSMEAEDGRYEMFSPEMLERLQNETEPSTFRIQINTQPEVSARTGKCNIMIGNPAQNQHDIQVYIALDDTGEEIYHSKILKPGERVVYDTLNQIPALGEHSATATFYMLDENQDIVGAVDAGLLIMVTEAE